MVHNHKAQKGVTLIVVLVGLLVITTVGAIAVKQSRGDLNIASSAEARSVMFWSTDLAYSKIEAYSQLDDSRQKGTFVGEVLSRDDNAEIVFCLRPLENKLFNSGKYTVLLDTKSWGTKANGNCIVGTTNDYTSKRGTMLTQISGKKTPIDETAKNFEAFADQYEGSDSGTGVQNAAKRFSVYSTTVLPVYAATTKDSDISNCLKNEVNDDYKEEPGKKIESVSDCLSKLGVPFNSQVQLYRATFKGSDTV